MSKQDPRHGHGQPSRYGHGQAPRYDHTRDPRYDLERPGVTTPNLILKKYNTHNRQQLDLDRQARLAAEIQQRELWDSQQKLYLANGKKAATKIAHRRTDRAIQELSGQAQSLKEKEDREKVTESLQRIKYLKDEKKPLIDRLNVVNARLSENKKNLERLTTQSTFSKIWNGLTNSPKSTRDIQENKTKTLTHQSPDIQRIPVVIEMLENEKTRLDMEIGIIDKELIDLENLMVSLLDMGNWKNILKPNIDSRSTSTHEPHSVVGEPPIFSKDPILQPREIPPPSSLHTFLNRHRGPVSTSPLRPKTMKEQKEAQLKVLKEKLRNASGDRYRDTTYDEYDDIRRNIHMLENELASRMWEGGRKKSTKRRGKKSKKTRRNRRNK
jgi:hypothetical protein